VLRFAVAAIVLAGTLVASAVVGGIGVALFVLVVICVIVLAITAWRMNLLEFRGHRDDR